MILFQSRTVVEDMFTPIVARYLSESPLGRYFGTSHGMSEVGIFQPCLV